MALAGDVLADLELTHGLLEPALLRSLQGLSKTAAHQCWKVRVNVLTERASQVGCFPVDNMWFILRRWRFGNWNNLAAV
jgi:hypothetical protein